MDRKDRVRIKDKPLPRKKPGEYLQAIINSLEDELLVIDRDYRIIEVNEAVLKRHGKSRSEIIGQHCYDVSHGLPELCHPPQLECPIKTVWETGQPSRVTHCHVYERDGEKQERFLDIIVSPITDSPGNTVAVVELMRDVTEAKIMEMKVAEVHHEVQLKDEARGELLREIFTIQEEERKRIARELHDETSQVLATLNASLEITSGMLPPGVDKVRARLKQAQELSVGILEELHRLIYELRPTLLDDLGLVAATRWLAENNLKAIGIKVDFKTTGQERRLSPQLETTLYRVIQEAINNIIRHARAKRALVRLNFKKSAISVNIKDDGRGFDMEEAIRSKERPRGLGLLGMQERVQILKGTIDIKSGPRRGTEIKIQIPLVKERGN